jgi:DNA-binding FadR family transcriptional regulator
MSPAHVLEPTYAAIKRQLKEAHWPMGTKLEAVRLADDLGVSITPVRDSLNRLFGERLVDFSPGDGFRVSMISEGELRNLFRLQYILLHAAVETQPINMPEFPNVKAALVDCTSHLFRMIASCSDNAELVTTVASINDRLHVPRSYDTRIFEDAEEELAHLWQAAMGSNPTPPVTRDLLTRYFMRRIAHAASYVRVLTEK